MAETSSAGRVLVVDDAQQVRSAVHRVLSAGGYNVDEAATLAEARSANPAGYDAVVVDLRLADGTGTDLIRALAAEDPAAAARCLVLTGGGVEALPPRTACLRKPFDPAELLAAVRALPLGAPAPPVTPSGRAVAPAVEPGPGSRSPVRQLLGMYREVRAREIREMAGYLHDGPVQDLTGAILELQMVRRTASPGQAGPLDAVLAGLATATQSLHRLLDEPPPPAPDAILAAALQERTAWLAGQPVTIDACPAAGLGRAAIPVIAETAALMVCGLVPAQPATHTRISVRPDGDAAVIELTATFQDAGEPAGRQPAVAAGWLDRLAHVLGATVTSEFGGERWRFTLTLPGQLAAPAA